LTESSYFAIAPNAAIVTDYLLFDGDGAGSLPGWYLTLEPNEKVITEAFSFAGVTIFTSFRADEIANDGGTCSRLGASHIFIVDTVRANGYAAGGARYRNVGDLTTPPFVERHRTRRAVVTPLTPTITEERRPSGRQSAVATLPVRELHSEHQDDPLDTGVGLLRRFRCASIRRTGRF
jgi:hypothetical protein